MALKPANPFLLAVLDAMGAAAGVLDDALLKLYTAGPVLSGTMVLADFTEADFDGYADVAIPDTSWTAAFMLNGVYPCLRGPMTGFTPTGSTTPNVVIGWMLTNAAGTTLYWAELLDEPVTMDGVTSHLDVVPQIVMKASSDYGSAPEF